MAGNKVRIEFNAQAQQAIQQFDKLSKAQQKVVLEGSKMGAEYEKLKNKAKKAGKAGESAFNGVARRIQSTFDLSTLFNKSIELGNRELENRARLQSKAFATQTTVSNAIGSLIANTGFKQNQIKSVVGATANVSTDLGLDQAKLIDAVTAAVSGAGGGNFSVDQIIGALRESAVAGRLDSELDIGALTTANLKLQQSGFTPKEAANFAKVFVQQFGGKLNEAVEKFPGLLGTVKGVQEFEKARFGKPVTKREDIFALFGALSQGPVPNIDQASTITENLFGRVNASGFDFKTQGTLQRLIEIGNAVNTGQIKDEDLKKTFTAAGAKGSKGLGVFSFLSTGAEDLRERQARLRDVDRPENIGRQQLQQFLAIPQVRQQIKAGRAVAGTGVAQFGDIQLGEREAAIEEFRKLLDTFGTSGGFFGLNAKLNEALVTAGATSPESLRATAFSEVGNTGPISKFFNAATEKQLAAQERAIVVYEKALEESKRTNKSIVEILQKIDIGKIIVEPGEGQ